VAGAVILDPNQKISGLKDSKLLTAPAREKLFEIISQKALAFGVGVVEHKIIDQKGLTYANHLAMIQALDALGAVPDYLLIDAVKLEYNNLPRQAIINGDYKIISIAAASIIAKVSRDRIMKNLALKFPVYGFEKHKGYGTKLHQEMIGQYGICRFHRQSFKPIKNLLK